MDYAGDFGGCEEWAEECLEVVWEGACGLVLMLAW